MEANGCPADKANMEGKRGVMVYRILNRRMMDFKALHRKSTHKGKYHSVS